MFLVSNNGAVLQTVIGVCCWILPQSEAACCFCACIARRFSCSPATARDRELIEMKHSCHHVDTIRHPNSRYVTTKLYERLHVDATIIRYFHNEPCSRFLPSTYARHVSMTKSKNGDTVEFITFRVYNFVSGSFHVKSQCPSCTISYVAETILLLNIPQRALIDKQHFGC